MTPQEVMKILWRAIYAAEALCLGIAGRKEVTSQNAVDLSALVDLISALGTRFAQDVNAGTDVALYEQGMADHWLTLPAGVTTAADLRAVFVGVSPDFNVIRTQLDSGVVEDFLTRGTLIRMNGKPAFSGPITLPQAKADTAAAWAAIIGGLR